MLSKDEVLRSRIIKFCQKNHEFEEIVLWNRKEEVVLSTLLLMLKVFQKEPFLQYLNPEQQKKKSGNGQKVLIMNNKNIQNLNKLFGYKDGISQKEAKKKLIFLNHIYLKL